MGKGLRSGTWKVFGYDRTAAQYSQELQVWGLGLLNALATPIGDNFARNDKRTDSIEATYKSNPLTIKLQLY